MVMMFLVVLMVFFIMRFMFSVVSGLTVSFVEIFTIAAVLAYSPA